MDRDRLAAHQHPALLAQLGVVVQGLPHVAGVGGVVQVGAVQQQGDRAALGQPAQDRHQRLPVGPGEAPAGGVVAGVVEPDQQPLLALHEGAAGPQPGFGVQGRPGLREGRGGQAGPVFRGQGGVGPPEGPAVSSRMPGSSRLRTDRARAPLPPGVAQPRAEPVQLRASAGAPGRAGSRDRRRWGRRASPPRGVSSPRAPSWSPAAPACRRRRPGRPGWRSARPPRRPCASGPRR